jgi:hypothetical protein
MMDRTELKQKIIEIILAEVETDSEYHGLDEYSVNAAANAIVEVVCGRLILNDPALSESENAAIWYNSLSSGEEDLLLTKYGHATSNFSSGSKEVIDMWRKELATK